VFGPFERTVAARYLRARRSERFVSIIAGFSLVGIALGVATLIIVMSVMNGFRTELLGRILGLNGDLGIYGVSAPLTNYDALAARVRGLPNVTQVFPLVEGQALLTADRGGAYGGLVRGIAPDDLRALKLVSDNIRLGSLDNFKGEDAAAIGVGLAQRLGIGIGEHITLVSPQGTATAFGTVPRIRAYTVVALFQVGFNEADTSFVFLPLQAAQIFFQDKNAVTQVEVMVKNPDAVGVVNGEIRRALAGWPQDMRVIDWTQSNNSLFAAVQVERNVMFLILTLIIVVAAFNVISSLIMMVKDKTKDIAVLRTLGASPGAVLRIFLMCGASVGVAGTAIGAILGIAFAENIDTLRHWLQGLTGTDLFNPEVYFLSQLPAEINWREVTQVVVMALALSLLATIYPSWRAARTDPVEALRSE
jgi:lipoprotein-releasing system permease protein